MNTEVEVAVYHPFIDLDDATLIRIAALYWDELRTIVPKSLESPYQRSASIEAYEAGFLKPRYVESDDDAVVKAGDEFLHDIENHQVKKNILRLDEDVASHEQEWLLHNESFSRPHLKKLASIHIDKLSERMRECLRAWARPDWVGVPSQIGNAYMSRLASAVAQRDNAVPLTNISPCHDIVIDRYIDFEGKAEKMQAQLATLSLQAVAVSQDVPLIDVLRFRDKEKNRELLLNYRGALRKISRRIREGSSDRQHKLVKEVVEDEILPSSEEIQKKLRESEIKFDILLIVGALQSLIGIVGSGGNPWYVAAGGAVALSAVLGCSIQEERAIVRDHPLGYLYKAQKRFGANA